MYTSHEQSPPALDELFTNPEDQMVLPMLRNPLRKIKFPGVSTFVPSAYNYFEVVQYMDKLMAYCESFERTGLPWHPFISRIYFAELFLIQILRARRVAKIGTRQERSFLDMFLEQYPPESLPVPGPLLPILQSIAACQPESDRYGDVCPTLPKPIGPVKASLGLSIDRNSYLLPNIPILIGFVHTIIDATPGDIPKYTDPVTFDDTQEHRINGFVFPANDWQNEHRTILSQPGMTNVPISRNCFDVNLNERGDSLSIPRFEENTPASTVPQFMGFEEDMAWFSNVREIMSEYALRFRQSGTLGDCPPSGPTCGLIRSKPLGITSGAVAENQIFKMTEAFPGKPPYLMEYDHRSYESEVPQLYSMKAMYGGINCMYRCDGMGDWDNLNIPGGGREGPYWKQNPSLLRCNEERLLCPTESIVASKCFKFQ